MKSATYQRLSTMVYEMRDRGAFPELDSGMGKDWQDKHTPFIYELLTLRRLANKHHKLAEMSCNGEGSIRGTFYSWDNSRSWAKSPATATPDVDVFEVESGKVEAKIKGICERLGLRVEFQGDPRGYTCKFFKGERFLDIQG